MGPLHLQPVSLQGVDGAATSTGRAAVAHEGPHLAGLDQLGEPVLAATQGSDGHVPGRAAQLGVAHHGSNLPALRGGPVGIFSGLPGHLLVGVELTFRPDEALHAPRTASGRENIRTRHVDGEADQLSGVGLAKGPIESPARVTAHQP